jgi:hypothetical protein
VYLRDTFASDLRNLYNAIIAKIYPRVAQCSSKKIRSTRKVAPQHTPWDRLNLIFKLGGETFDQTADERYFYFAHLLIPFLFSTPTIKQKACQNKEAPQNTRFYEASFNALVKFVAA